MQTSSSSAVKTINSSIKTILLTGATGYIGSVVAERLIAKL